MKKFKTLLVIIFCTYLSSLFIAVSSCYCSNVELTVDGEIFFISIIDNFMIIGYKNNDEQFCLLKSNIESGKFKDTEIIGNNYSLFEKYENSFNKQIEENNKKYKRIISKIITSKDTDKFEELRRCRRNGSLYYGMCSPSPDKKRNLFLFSCDDGHSLFSSRIIMTNMDDKIILKKVLCNNETNFSYTRNIGWINNSTIFYDIHSQDIKNKVIIETLGNIRSMK